MFEHYYATMGTTDGYSQIDLDRFNRFLEMELDVDDFHNQDQLNEAAKTLYDRFLTDNPIVWPF